MPSGPNSRVTSVEPRPAYRSSLQEVPCRVQSLSAQFGKLYLLLVQMTEPNEHYAHFTVTGGSILQGSGGRLVMMMLGMECCARDSNLRTSRFRGNARLFPSRNAEPCPTALKARWRNLMTTMTRRSCGGRFGWMRPSPLGILLLSLISAGSRSALAQDRADFPVNA